ncbi:MAG: hypothetical protein WCC60_14315, partial [Ilumatobacteraceae bacterium]
MDQNERIRLLEAAVAELSASLRIAGEDAGHIAREAVVEHTDDLPDSDATIAEADPERTSRRGALR